MKYLKDLVYILLICVIIFLWLKSCEKNKTRESNYKAIQDTLVKVRNKKDSSLTASIKVITGDQKDASDFIKDTDTGKRVKETIKKGGKRTISATSLNLHTSDTASGTTRIDSSSHVGLSFGPTVGIVYRSTIIKRRASYELYMDADSSSIIARVDNKIDINVEYEKLKFKDFIKKPSKLFAPDTLKVKATAYNPGTDFDEITSYQYTQKKKNTGAKVATGTIIGAILALIFIR